MKQFRILRWKLKSIFLLTTYSDPNVQSIYCIIFGLYISPLVKVLWTRLAGSCGSSSSSYPGVGWSLGCGSGRSWPGSVSELKKTISGSVPYKRSQIIKSLYKPCINTITLSYLWLINATKKCDFWGILDLAYLTKTGSRSDLSAKTGSNFL